MRGTLKTAALEHYFPLLAVEHDCILSKNAEVTVAYRVVLPELFTLTGAEYEALHGAWLKALRVLPDYTIVHKQDYFTEEHYRPTSPRTRAFWPGLRASLQRATLPAALVLSLHHEDLEGTDAAPQRLLVPLPGFHRAPGDPGHGVRNTVSGCCGADAPHPLRCRLHTSGTSYGR